MARTSNLRLSSSKTESSVIKKRSSTNNSHQARTNNNPNWQSIVTLNENSDVAKDLRTGKNKWDFSHLQKMLEIEAHQHEDSDFFLFGTSPYIYCSSTGNNDVCPTIGILRAPRGETPPQFVQLINPKDATEEIVSFSEFGIEWKLFGIREFGYRVYALKQIWGTIDSKILERAKLWNLMGQALQRKENGELDIQKANFEYQKPNGEWICEVYLKGMSQYSNICKMHNMVMKDDQGDDKLDEETGDIQVDQELLSGLKQAIKKGFVAARNEREEQIAMLEKGFPSFASIQSMKVFPQNEVIRECFRNRSETEAALATSEFFNHPPPTAGNNNIGYINESYGTVSRIFPGPNPAN